jgi:hypothetical protein
MIGRIISRILHRIIRGMVMHPIRLVIFLIALVAAGALVMFQSGLPSLSLAMPSPSFRVGGSAPSSTESYMKGNETFNAELVWNALSEEAQGRLRSRGTNIQALQEQMDQAKQAGRQFNQVTYIGGQSFADGTSMHFYTVLSRGLQSRGEPEPIPYVFTLDQSGKIVRVQ